MISVDVNGQRTLFILVAADTGDVALRWSDNRLVDPERVTYLAGQIVGDTFYSAGMQLLDRQPGNVIPFPDQHVTRDE